MENSPYFELTASSIATLNRTIVTDNFARIEAGAIRISDKGTVLVIDDA